MIGMQTRLQIKRILSTLLLLVACGFVTFPILWMVTASFKTNPEIFRVFPVFPKKFDFIYFRELLSGKWIPFVQQYTSTFIIASVQTVAATAFALAAAFVFARYRFRFSRLLYVLAITVILIPHQVMIVPLFSWINKLGLYDNLFAVILPGTVSGIGILFLTEIIRRVPNDLLDIARIEGASEYRLLPIIYPLIKPGVLTYALIHFILAWHEHLLPLVFLDTAENLTVSVALNSLASANLRVGFALLMSGSTLTLIPTILFYLVVRRHFDSTLSQLTSQ